MDRPTPGGSARNEYQLPADVDYDEAGHTVKEQITRLFKIILFGRGRGLADHPDSSRGGSSFFSSTTVAQRKTRGEEEGRDSTSRTLQKFKLTRGDSISYSVSNPRIISPHDKYYLIWEQWILLLSIYSVIVTPIEFGFYRGIPDELAITDIAINVFFVIDIILVFFIAYKDKRTFVMVEDHKKIALRYLTTRFTIDLLNCLPWDSFYKASGQGGAKEILRWFIWFRLSRAYRVDQFFTKIERDIRFNYYGARIARLLAILFSSTHVAGCFFYYLASTISEEDEGNSWMGSLTLGSNSYSEFRNLDLGKRYVTAVYWATVTMASVGYGDAHPVNPREMLFCIVYIAFNVVLTAYLLGNITALIVKGSSTEKYRDKMATLVQYMHRKRLPRSLRHQMRQHLRLQFEADRVEDDIIEDFPISIRHKVSLALYRDVAEQCFLFRNCSREFVDQIVCNSSPEFFMPQEVVIHQRDAGEFIYIIVSGALEEMMLERDGSEKFVADLFESDVVGEVGVLCSIPQPFTVNVQELTQVLRVDKQTLSTIMTSFIIDGKQVVDNLLQRSKEENSKISAMSIEIENLIEQQEADLIMTTINAASRGDIQQLRQLVRVGSKVDKSDYDGRTALHLAAEHGYTDMVSFLILEGADVNAKDHFGVTPLQEALRSGHEDVAQLLVTKGAVVNLQEAGTDLCNAVIHGNTTLLQRLLDYGVDPNSADYDRRTPLHIAAAEGFLLIVRILVDHGADVFVRDRWGNTPLDEAQRCASQPVIRVIEEAMISKMGGNLQRQKQEIGGTETDATLALVAASVEEIQASEPTDAAAMVKRGSNLSLDNFDSIAEDEDHPVHGGKKTSLAKGGESGNLSVIVSSPKSKESPAGTPASGRRSRGPGGFRTSNFSGQPAKKRVTIYPYHPWSAGRKPGRLIFVPPTIKDLLHSAQQHFGGSYSQVLNSDGGEISTIDLVLDGDRLYFSDGTAPEPTESTALLG